MVNNEIVESYWAELKIWDTLKIQADFFSCDESVREMPIMDSQIILYHKPIGYTVSKNDPHNQTIYTILPKELQQYDYIGRLDKDSSWLLLLTNDKGLVHELGHPSSGLLKTYKVRVDSALDDNQIQLCETGVRVDEQGTTNSKIADKEWLTELLKFEKIYQEERSGYVQLTIQLYEWHKRHIRRLLRSIQKKVFTIHRTSFGKYKLWDIKIWERSMVLKND